MGDVQQRGILRWIPGVDDCCWRDRQLRVQRDCIRLDEQGWRPADAVLDGDEDAEHQERRRVRRSDHVHHRLAERDCVHDELDDAVQLQEQPDDHHAVVAEPADGA
eukprot:TRINITY_DN695_c0_g1_i4.p2 TRINITY_DN695_c0_g1~~TRINITY_DN695_c0_g1_i4.p2  ORF type:complete len:116 (-),score=13.81 TRINITY_DN695_c0_g1_i4:641-958(-)